MAFFSRSRLFGILLISASLPFDPGVALALGAAGAQAANPDAAQPPPDVADASLEERLRRIAAAVRERQGETADAAPHGLPDDAQAVVFVNGPGLGWANGGFRNGGFYNGGFRNGGFYNGGFRNGGFRNGGWRNGGWRNRW